VAKGVGADSDAVLELQGFADPRGSDRYNSQLARERVEAVIRYLVQDHGIELRQIRAVAMGKVALGAGEKATELLAVTALDPEVSTNVEMSRLVCWLSCGPL
jgi:outer membrane protein OmpA-like peptidoglycan-associated protein